MCICRVVELLSMAVGGIHASNPIVLFTRVVSARHTHSLADIPLSRIGQHNTTAVHTVKAVGNHPFFQDYNII